MGKKLQKYLDEAEKTEQQIAELEERLRTIRAAQKKEEDSEIIRAIRSTKMGGREESSGIPYRKSKVGADSDRISE